MHASVAYMHIFCFCFKTMNTTTIEERVEQAWAGFLLSYRNLSCSTNEIAIFFSLVWLTLLWILNILEYFHSTHEWFGQNTRLVWEMFSNNVFVSSVINLKHSDILICQESYFTHVIMKNSDLPRPPFQCFFSIKNIVHWK
jgi:hypothetical protein